MLEGAKALWEAGFGVIQLGRLSKKPARAWAEYQDRRATDEEIENWWEIEPDGNVGITTGQGVAVVDADSEDAAAWVEAHLPRTPWRVKTGRGWHYYYSENWGARNVVNERGKVDVRGRGGYVVAPPSIHQTGSEYSWVRDSGTEGWTVDDLPELTREHVQSIEALGVPTFDAGVFGRLKMKATGEPVQTGGRNNAAASLVGQMIHDGVDELGALERLQRWNSTNPEPLDEKELKTTVNSVFKTHDRNHGVPDIPVQAPPKRKLGLKQPDLRPPGVLGKFYDWHLETARFPNQVLAAQSALAFGSVVLGRRWRTTQDNWTGLYLMTLGKSTTGKEHAKKTLESALESCGLDDLCGGRGYSSVGAVVSELRSKPNHISIIDEMSGYLQACHARGNSHRKEAISMLIEVFSIGGGKLRQMAYSTMGHTERQKDEVRRVNVKAPSITLFGLTQPGTFYESVGSSSVTNGFLGRLLCLDMQAERRPGRDVGPLTEPPGELVAWSRKARTEHEGIGAHLGERYELMPKVSVIGVSDAARQVYREFDLEKIKHQDRLESLGLDVIVGRMHEIAMRLGGIVACSVDIDRPTVTEEIARYACSYSRFAFLGMARAAERNLTGGSEYGKQRAAILDAIAEGGERGVTKRELGRRFKHVKPKERNEILRDLSDTGEAVKASIKHKGGGRPRVAYIAE